ncbi:MAG TPA: ATP-binding cassette domain-containing protein [Candidatus Caenarcaniphilales bacterium]|nr:ATP-binding cassette domain-containing protein [Candidatus Caenarcaniphilales bacterium]
MADRRPAQSPAVVVDSVWKRFGRVDVVRDLSFQVQPGEVLGFLGPNGAGKTTQMRMILDIIRPDRGRIEVFGQKPGLGQQQRVGYLPEERGLYRDVPVLETLAYFGALKGLSARDARARAVRLLTDVGLGDALHKKAAELSRGMHQKVQVIATVLHDPDLLIIDEPFQGLDPLNAQMLREVVLNRRERGAAVVMSTHDMNDAQRLCDRILLIDKGRRLLYGRVTDVQRAFSSGAVEVEGDRVPTDTALLRSVSDASTSDGRVRFLLRDGVAAPDLFRELAASGADVRRFEVATPTLNEIFIRAVAGDPRAADVQ